ERPYYPYALLIMDPRHDQIVAMDLLSPLPDLASMYGQVPLTIIQKLAGTGLRPRHITVKSLRLFGLLKPLERESGFAVRFNAHLPVLEQAKASFVNFYRNRF
ncbi:MAG TPA: hypothetical protein VJZ27_06010, partial [Aggregatilineales bacterium]|nr:hypothetical protein [Aggregatilineales bacterium]